MENDISVEINDIGRKNVLVGGGGGIGGVHGSDG